MTAKPQNVVAFFLGGPEDGKVTMVDRDALCTLYHRSELTKNALAFVWANLPVNSQVTLFETLRPKFAPKPSPRSDSPEGL